MKTPCHKLIEAEGHVRHWFRRQRRARRARGDHRRQIVEVERELDLLLLEIRRYFRHGSPTIRGCSEYLSQLDRLWPWLLDRYSGRTDDEEPT